MSLTHNVLYNRVISNIGDPPCLRFYNSSNFTITLSDSASGVFKNRWNGDIFYSLDKITWRSVIGHAAITTKIIYFYGIGNDTTLNSSYKIYISNGSAYCGGDIAILLDIGKFSFGRTITAPDNCFSNFFAGNSGLKSAPKLGFNSVGISSCASMFEGCTSLTTPPELPAKNLARSCYNSMFKECTGLVRSPSLPATTLAYFCYSSMFSGCTSLISPPALPAISYVSEYAMLAMFWNCTSLLRAPLLYAPALGFSCYQSMFRGCTSLTTPPALPATSLGGYCYSNMFASSGVNTLAKMPALTYSNHECSGMYYGTNIKISQSKTGVYQYAFRIPNSGTGSAVEGSFDSMFSNTSGTFTGTPTINTTYYTDKPLVE